MPLLGGRKKSGKNLIDRDPQNLPVSVGGFRVVRRTRRTSSQVKWWRATAPNLVAGIGLLLAVGGAFAALTREPVPAGSAGATIDIGGSKLRETGDGTHLYVGNAAMVYLPQPDGSHVAAASTYANGKNVAGFCTLPPRKKDAAEIQETCSFWIGVPTTGNPTITSVDTYNINSDTAEWHRKYSDGVSVDLIVPQGDGVIAVPLPLGH